MIIDHLRINVELASRFSLIFLTLTLGACQTSSLSNSATIDVSPVDQQMVVKSKDPAPDQLIVVESNVAGEIVEKETPIEEPEIEAVTNDMLAALDSGQLPVIDETGANLMGPVVETKPVVAEIIEDEYSPPPAPPALQLHLKMAQSTLSIAEIRHDRIEKEQLEADAAALLQRQTSAWHRLQHGMKMTSVMNKRVRVQLDWYLKHRGYLQRVMERARPILPFILDELENRQLPTELALLPIVESAYRAFAYSHGRASGLWQIIPSTGRYLGLKQNWWYDGRRDILDSTRAAMYYLDSLANQFDGDWELALASYNAGPGRIRGAIRHNKKKEKPTDFWHLTQLKKETLAYVPKLLALKELFQNPAKYNLDLLHVSNQVEYGVVQLDGQIDLALAADLAGISVNQLYQLNPAFNRWATPPKGPHRLLLPRGQVVKFKQAIAQIPANERINWVRHKIKTGETLSHISQKYQTTTQLIKSVNKIKGTQIRAGKYLMVPTATQSLKTYSLSKSSRIDKVQNTQREGEKQTHIVRSEQSLWSISRTYGVTTSALAKWNGIAPIDTLRIGQKLVIWTKPSKSLQTVSYSLADI
ncbi:MAG: membrane-bound lytic murein transglycosylase D, partial [Gammaproteobacteria bacterium]